MAQDLHAPWQLHYCRLPVQGGEIQGFEVLTHHHMGVSMAMGGTAKWMVYNGKSHIKMDDYRIGSQDKLRLLATCIHFGQYKPIIKPIIPFVWPLGFLGHGSWMGSRCEARWTAAKRPSTLPRRRPMVPGRQRWGCGTGVLAT